MFCCLAAMRILVSVHDLEEVLATFDGCLGFWGLRFS